MELNCDNNATKEFGSKHLYVLNDQIYDEDNLIECLDEDSIEEHPVGGIELNTVYTSMVVSASQNIDINQNNDAHLNNEIYLFDGSDDEWIFVNKQDVKPKETVKRPAEAIELEVRNVQNNLSSMMVLINGETYYACVSEGCGKYFSTKSQYRSHMKIHGGVKLYKCVECGKDFIRMASLTLHMRVHTGSKPFPCKWLGCEKSYKSSSDLLRHSRSHTGDRPFKCTYPECTKGFVTDSNLKQHLVTHTTERNFICSVCSKSFRRALNLRSHERIHNGEKPFTCGICPLSPNFRLYSSTDEHTSKAT